MTYVIRLSKRAITDLEDIRAFIARESPAHALLYAAELRDRIVSLTHMPRRCPRAPEGRLRGQDVRHLVHDSYRILYIINGTTVLILRVIHGARANVSVGSA